MSPLVAWHRTMRVLLSNTIGSTTTRPARRLPSLMVDGGCRRCICVCADCGFRIPKIQPRSRGHFPSCRVVVVAATALLVSLQYTWPIRVVVPSRTTVCRHDARVYSRGDCCWSRWSSGIRVCSTDTRRPPPPCPSHSLAIESLSYALLVPIQRMPQCA